MTKTASNARLRWARVRLQAIGLRRARGRLDGVTAASWQVGYFTKDRTDLPYPPAHPPHRPTLVVVSGGAR